MILHSPTISGSLIFAEGATFTLPDGGIYSGSFSGSYQGDGTNLTGVTAEWDGTHVGNASIDGNLTVDGDISGSLLVHEVKSHLIPNANEVYDLGSASNRFRDLYISNGTIKFGGGAIGVNASGEVILTDYSGNYIPLLSSEMKMVDASTGDIVVLSVQGGQLVTTATDSNGSAIDSPSSNLSGSFSGSFLGQVISTNGVISGSEQVVIADTNGFNSFSSSIASTFSGLSSDFDDLVNNPFTQSVSSVTITKNLVPSNANLTLGTSELPFKDLYLSSASLYIDGQQVISSNANELIITTDANQSLKLVETGADTITLQTANGDITLASSGTGNIELDAPVQIAAGNKILSSDGNAVVFGDDLSVEGNITVTGTVDGVDVAALKTNVDAILSGSQADKDSFAEIVSLINSVDTTNDSAFAGFVTSSNAAQAAQDDRLDALEGTDIVVSLTGDVVGSGTITDLGDVTISTTIQPNSVVLGTDTTGNYMSNVSAGNAGISISHTQGEGSTATISLVSGVISGSSQVVLNSADKTGFDTGDVSEGSNLYYTDARVKTKLNAEGVISSSAQITITESQISDLDHYTDTDWDNRLATKSTSNLTEGSNLYYTDARVKTKLSAEGVISSSAQITITESQISDLDHYTDTDFDNRLATKSTTNLTEGTNLYYTDARVKTKLTAEGVISGSSQVVLNSADKTGFDTGDVSEGSNLYYTDARVKTKLNAEGVISGSSQVLGNTGIVSGSSQIDALGFLKVGGDSVISGSSQITLLGDITGTANNTAIASGVIVNADVNASAAIAYTKLNLNGSGILSGSSQVQAGSITGDIALGAQTSGNYVATLGTGTGVTIGSNTGEGSSPTIAVNYGSTANTAVEGDTTISFGGTSGEISIDAGSSITLGSGGTVTIGLADTITGNRTFSNNVTITGNLTVNGTTTTVNSNTVTIGDNIIVLNSDEAGTPSQDGGINIERGTSTNAGLIWSEANDYWMAGLVGSEERIVVGAGNTSINTLGTITTGTWNGSVIASAYLDADTAHLSGTQTFTGAKSFQLGVNIDANTASTSISTGALIVDGGVGIAGALNVGGDVVAYASSDKRLKDNIKNIENPIEKVQKLNGVTWDWNSNADELQQSLPNVGVIAQEVEEVFPQLVHDRDNGYKGVDYAKLTGLLIEAIKDQQKQIDELKSRLG